MKKLLALQLTIVFVCIQLITALAQDSVKKVKTTLAPAVKSSTYTSARVTGPVDPRHPPINKLVQNVRYAYYPDKTDAQVAALVYASATSYNGILDRIYNEYDAKKGIPRSVFDADMVRKYGDPFPSATKVAVVPPPVKPIADTTKPAVVAAPPVVVNEKSLSSQYQYLLTKVYNYQQPIIGAFHKSIMDTLIQSRNALKDANTKLAVQTKTIDSLQADAKANGESLSASNARVNDISLFGIELDKTTYNLVMWGLVLLLGIIAIVVIARSGANSREAKYRIQLYNELEEEYKTYKAKANEKEKKLARELQTERNKLDELLGRG